MLSPTAAPAVGITGRLLYRVYKLLDGHEPPSHRTLSRLARVVGWFGGGDASVVLDLGFPFRVWLDDAFWVRYLYSREPYEAEAVEALRRCLPVTDVFLDCGANIGYWTNFVCSNSGCLVVAIEPCTRAFRRLGENVQLCPRKPTLFQRALFNEPGLNLTMSAGATSHVGNHLLVPGMTWTDHAHREGVEEVTTTTVDALLADTAPDASRVVIKLDVEGAEVAALSGARELLNRKDWLLIYEDHGLDKSHEVSRYVLQDLRLPVYFFADGEFRRVTGLDEIGTIKAGDRSRGFNFFSARPNGVFADRLDARGQA